MSTYTSEQLKEILSLHGKWLRDEPDGQRANLTDANLYGADLTDANLYGADLTDANLTDANLTDASLYGANLTDAILTRADLYGANLAYAYLRGANLYGADLTDANLYGADLYGANLAYAYLRGANLYGADLTDANLTRADLTDAKLTGIRSLWGAVGNMAEIKSMQVDTWPVTYTATHMQIGCQLHLLSDWWAFDDEQIGDMDRKALEWWTKAKPMLRACIEAYPATGTAQ